MHIIQNPYNIILKKRSEDKQEAEERDRIKKQIKQNREKPRLNTSRKSELLRALKSQANQLPPHFEKRKNY